MGVQTDVVDTPGVDGDGGDALGSGVGGFAQAFIDAGEDGIQGPAQR